MHLEGGAGITRPQKYMDKEKSEEFKTRLLEEKAKLLVELERIERDSLDNIQDQAQEGAWGADVATDVYEEERIQTERIEAMAHLAEVDKALERLEKGTFGISVVSGKPIPEERLEVLPWATCLVEEEVRKNRR